MSVQKINLYPPHMKVTINVNEQMQQDYRACRKRCEETGEIGNCETCSWNDVSFGAEECICSMDEVARQMDALESK